MPESPQLDGELSRPDEGVHPADVRADLPPRLFRQRFLVLHRRPPDPTVRTQRSASRALGPRSSASRPEASLLWNSICQSLSCAWTNPWAKSRSWGLRA